MTYVGAPVVSSLAPSSGPRTGGTISAVHGSNFSRVRSVTIGGVVSAFHVESPTLITVTTPAHSSSGRAVLEIATVYGRNSTGTFLYTTPPATGPVPALVGRVTRANGSGLANAEVDVFSVGMRVLYNTGYTTADGSYTFSSAQLPAGTYKVCINALGATDELSDAGAPYGYTVQCSAGQAWNGELQYNAVPSSAAAVSVSPDRTATVNSVVAAASQVTGVATDTVNRFSLDTGFALFKDGELFAYTTSNTAGNRYLFSGLLPGAYTVCTNSSDLHTVGNGVSFAPNGYESQCWNAVDWDPTTTDMTAAEQSATVASLGADESRTMDFGLAPNSFVTLSGRVTATDGEPLTGVDVEPILVTPSTMTGETDAYTDANGDFSFHLAVGTYKLCFWAGESVVGSPGVSTVSGGPSQGGYESQCYNGASGPDSESTDTDALIAAATPIPVGTSGAITVHPQLASLATLAGTVESPSGAPVGGSVLWLYQDGTRLASVLAGTSDGTFSFKRIEPGVYTLCLVPYSDAAKAFGETNRCYNGVMLTSESVAPSAAEAETGTPISIVPGERHQLVFTLAP